LTTAGGSPCASPSRQKVRSASTSSSQKVSSGSWEIGEGTTSSEALLGELERPLLQLNLTMRAKSCVGKSL